jgi:peptidoglycan/xylan/chitin deacetylase (PgdA/CDA1 family)
VRALLDRFLCALGQPGRHRRRHARDLTVLMYHGVVEERLVPDCWHQLPRRDFVQQLAWLARHYDILPLDEALDRQAAGQLERPTAALTFDDGFLNNRTVAWPVLQHLGLPATIFLPTGALGGHAALWPDRCHLAIAKSTCETLDAAFLGLGRLPLHTTSERTSAINRVLRALKGVPTKQRADHEVTLRQQLGRPPLEEPGPFRVMTEADVAAMDADPLISFGAHTRTHPILSMCEDAVVVEEVVESVRDVASLVAQPARTFSYPNGRAIDFDARARDAVEAAGLTRAVSTESGFVDAQSDPLALRRIAIGSDLSFDRFRLVVSGAWA